MTLANQVNAQVLSQEQCQEILQEAGHSSDIDFFVTGLMVNNYIPDNPGYTGPIAWVLFSGGPDCQQTYIKRDGKWISLSDESI
jgi:hypothetical protein